MHYRDMTEEQLIAEQDEWLLVCDAPKGPGGPSNGARRMAEAEMYLAEAWYHRKYKAKE